MFFYLVFLIIELHFSIPAVITQIFNPTAEFVIPIGILTTEAKLEIETQLMKVEAKINEHPI